MANAHLPFLITVFMSKCNFKALAQNLYEVSESGEFLRHKPSQLTIRTEYWKYLLGWASAITSLTVTQKSSGCAVLQFSAKTHCSYSLQTRQRTRFF